MNEKLISDKQTVALYGRVSLDEQEKERFQDPENQLVPLRQYCQMQGFEVYKEYIDKDSGANPNRLAFRAMLTDAHQGKFKTIICWKLDRFSREPMLSTLSYLRDLQRKGVAVKSLTESWLDTSSDNPMSEVVLAVMAWAAAEERRKISERTKAGIQRLRNIGQWHGGRPKKGEGMSEPSKV
jgi:DNA invertase Pin-like site-specific DNA recombinase